MLKVTIEGNEIVIRLGFDVLPAVADIAQQEAGWCDEYFNSQYEVTDTKKFADDLLGFLDAEEEDGQTIVTKMFDAAIIGAIENGADGVTEIKED